MPPTTTNTPLISDAHLALQWQQLTSSISSARAQDLDDALVRIAEAKEIALEPLLGVFAQRVVTGEVSKPESLSELLAFFVRFITQGISEYEQKAVDFEQKFINTFRQHQLMALTPQSFSKGARRMTVDTLESAIGLVTDLNVERIALENEISQLELAFKDPDGRIILARDRVHKVANQLAAIQGYADQLQKSDLDAASQREYLTAIQTMIRKIAEMKLSHLEDNPIELFSKMNPRVTVTMNGSAPTFLDQQHPKLIVTALEHLARNAYDAGAANVRIKADYKSTDPLFAIGIEDDGPGIPETKLKQLLGWKGGSGWRILREVTLKQLGAHFEITSPFQNVPKPHGTLVMLFIPVAARTGDGPGTGKRRPKADSGPLSAVSSLTPSAPLPAVQKPASMAVGLASSVAGAAAVFSENPPGVVLKFEKLK